MRIMRRCVKLLVLTIFVLISLWMSAQEYCLSKIYSDTLFNPKTYILYDFCSKEGKKTIYYVPSSVHNNKADSICCIYSCKIVFYTRNGSCFCHFENCKVLFNTALPIDGPFHKNKQEVLQCIIKETIINNMYYEGDFNNDFFYLEIPIYHKDLEHLLHRRKHKVKYR
jgi:hypothetical protein